jgi:hypothetical protein
MAISANAQRNHDQLCGPYIGYPRTLNGLAAIHEIAPAEG